MASVRREFLSGVFYTSIAKYSGIVVQIIITSILARLLTPSDFGIVAIATVLIQFFNTLSEAGIGPAIIQKKQLDKREIESIFTVTILLGILLMVAFFSTSHLIASYYENKELVGVCQWLSLLILFSSLDIVPNSLLLKQKRFKLISFRTLITQIITGILSVLAAYHGWGLYALVLSAILSKALVFLTNYFCNPLKLVLSFRGISEIKSYSLYQFSFNMVNYFARNFDKMIVGKYIGLSPLGYYEKSYRLMMLPLNNITFVISPVMHPIFSNFQNQKDEMLSKYLKLLKVMSCLSFPAMIFLFFSARELVLIFFGSQWEKAISSFQILSLTVALQVLVSSSGGLFQSLNYTKGLFLCGLVSAILMLGGFYLSAIFYGTIESVAVSYVITCTISGVFAFKLLFYKLNSPISRFFKSIHPGFVLTALLLPAMIVCQFFTGELNMIVSLVIKVLLVLGISLAYLSFVKIINIKERKLDI